MRQGQLFDELDPEILISHSGPSRDIDWDSLLEDIQEGPGVGETDPAMWLRRLRLPASEMELAGSLGRRHRVHDVWRATGLRILGSQRVPPLRHWS